MSSDEEREEEEMTEDPNKLLKEWFEWWIDSNEAPNKMPNSLHTRTVVYLKELEYEGRTSSDPGND